MSLYIDCRCPKCHKLGKYANDSKDILVCDNCSFSFDKIDGMKEEKCPKYTRVRNELRKKYVL